jgi:hypothetical protein
LLVRLISLAKRRRFWLLDAGLFPRFCFFSFNFHAYGPESLVAGS